MSFRALVNLLPLLGAAVFASGGTALAGDAERKAVERSLPFLEKEGVTWIKERACVTCHQTTFLIWTHNEAARRGLEVGERKLSEWTQWALLKAIAGEDGSTPAGSETLAQLLLSRSEAPALSAKPSRWQRTTDPYENVVKHLLEDQTKDGCWLAGGQSENPPEIPTGWALIAMAAHPAVELSDDAGKNIAAGYGPGLATMVRKNQTAWAESRSRALAWLRSVKEDVAADLNEQWVVRLLVEKALGDPERVVGRREALLRRQREDGGWAADPRLGQGSDAFATGQALYALMRSGLPPDAPAVRRGSEFLTRTQQANGAWDVRTTAFHPPTGKGARDAKTDPIYAYWGTAWATLGLLETLPVASD
jgi:hypothetical protein